MENPIKMDDLGVPLFSETSISMRVPILLVEFALAKVLSLGGGCHNYANGESTAAVL